MDRWGVAAIVAVAMLAAGLDHSPGALPVGASGIGGARPGAGAGSALRPGAGSRPDRVDLIVRYPERSQRIEPDSNFLFGSVGDERAGLRINGSAVPVEPGGGFLAWLPVPEPERGDTAFYRIVAWEGGDSARLTLPVLRPRRAPPAGAASPWFDRRPLASPPVRWVTKGEEIELDVLAEEGAVLRLVAGESRFPLEPEAAGPGSLRRYRGRLDPSAVRDAACRAGACRPGLSDLGPRGAASPRSAVPIDTLTLTIVARKDGRETTGSLELPLAILEAGRAGVAGLAEAPDPVNGSSGVVVGRPTPFGPYRWRFPNGTVAPVTGRLGDRLRVELAEGLGAWVLAEDARWTDVDTDDPARAWDGRAEPAPYGAIFRVGLSRAVPAEVEVTGERSLAIVLHDTVGEIDRIAHGSGTGVASVRWSQHAGPRVRIDLELEWPVWGHRVEIERGDARAYEGPRGDGAAADGTVLRVEIRRPPVVDPVDPLRGRRIAVDPGHPGAGSTGPTGLYEGDANLAVARRLVAQLGSAGADPVLIRPDRGAVGLYERTRRARAAGAELFVSIHNNALPDGIRPFDRSGTTTYYHHPHSARLAGAVQRAMVERLGLPDLGVVWGDLAVAREPWMPAVLVEGAFIMVPSHEAALRTPEFQERYARGVLEGIASFLSAFSAAPGSPAPAGEGRAAESGSPAPAGGVAGG